EFKDTEELNGLFSGYDPAERRYRTDSWQYAGQAQQPSPQEHLSQDAMARPQHTGQLTQQPQTDPTLQHPNCVFQILRRHFARYTPELVERVCGVPRPLFLKVAETITA